MEIFELKYFAAVAETENIHMAAGNLNISASALSKAIGRLEEELKVNLFERDGRNIRITPQGRKLFNQCSRFFELEVETKILISGKDADIEIRLVGPEVFLSYYGINLTNKIQKDFPKATFRYEAMNDLEAQEAVFNRKADICIVNEQIGKYPNLKFRKLDKVSFSTYIGEGHPLFKTKKAVSINEVLAYDFLAPSENLLGEMESGSHDGWRDDKFERKIRYKNVGLKTLESLLLRGQAIAYLPLYFVEGLPVRKLEITGCPYTCEQQIVMGTKDAWFRYQP